MHLDWKGIAIVGARDPPQRFAPSQLTLESITHPWRRYNSYAHTTSVGIWTLGQRAVDVRREIDDSSGILTDRRLPICLLDKAHAQDDPARICILGELTEVYFLY